MITEADTCRKYVLPKLTQAGWDNDPHSFTSPKELWQRLQTSQKLEGDLEKQLLTPSYIQAGKTPRYYQEIAINRTVQAIFQGKPRILLTMATGTGKTLVAFQICWKLWNARWNKSGEYKRPKILYLADRNILIDDPKDKDFAPFGDARWKIENGLANKGREIYFSTYQSIAKDERRPGLYKEYAPDFFDLIVVDECHRGSARDESNWREILEYFKPAYQLGMTATPLREDNRDTYRYFGNPIYSERLNKVVTLSVSEGSHGLEILPLRQAQGQNDRSRYVKLLKPFTIASAANQPDSDPFDLLCHIAYNAPLRTRRERADRLRKDKKDFFDQYGPEAKMILNELLDKYADYGTAQFIIPDVLKVPPISEHGNVIEIANFFGGPEKLKDAVNQLQTLLYAA